MVVSRSRVVLVACLLLSAVGSAAAQQADDTGEPRLNQPGKDVQWVPTPPALVEKMLDMAGVTSHDSLVDLGSGDGVTVIAAAKRGARARGIEYDRQLVQIARRNAAAAGVTARAKFERGDIFKSDFSNATVVTTFLLPSLNLRLRPILLAMKPGTRVVSNTFPMGDWEPDDKAAIEPCERWCTALFWIVPARVAGVWRSSQGVLTLTQHFQMVSGTLDATGIDQGRLRGDQLSFSAAGTSYVGRIDEGQIRGTASRDGRTTPWSATRLR
jgi:SAM-dependent methyltransferase